MQALADTPTQGPPGPPSIEDAIELAIAAVHAEFGWVGVVGLAVAVLGFVVGMGAKLWAKRSRQHLLTFVVALGRRQWSLALVSLWRFWGTMHSTEDPAEFLRLAAKTLDRSGNEDARVLAVRVASLYEDALRISDTTEANS